MEDVLSLKHLFNCIISGRKSLFCIRFLEILDSLCTKKNFDGGTMWCYCKRTAVPAQYLSEIRNNIRLYKGVPENFKNEKCKTCLKILDDLLDVVYSEEMYNLFIEKQSSSKYSFHFD